MPYIKQFDSVNTMQLINDRYGKPSDMNYAYLIYTKSFDMKNKLVWN